jgi:hypothetical protein
MKDVSKMSAQEVIDNELYGFTYIKNQFGARKGIIVAIPRDGSIFIGWSFCNPKDKFNTNEGLVKAIEKAQTSPTMYNFENLPQVVKNQRRILMHSYVEPLVVRMARRWYDPKKK